MEGEAALSLSCGRCELGVYLEGETLVTYTLILLEPLLDVLLGDVWLLVPGVLLCGLIDLRQMFLRGTDHVGGLLGRIGRHVADQNNGITHCR